MPRLAYLLNRIESRVCRLNGIQPSRSLPRKPELRQSFADHVMYSSDQLPPKVDLRANMTSVEDQSKIGSCVANSLAGAYEYLAKKGNGYGIDVSRLFIYYNARASKNQSGELTDSGCSMTDGIETLQEYGVCLESMWPYNIQNVNVTPDQQTYQAADDFKITEAFQVDLDLNQMKSCLAQGFPFTFGLKLFTSFDKAAKSGVVPIPDPDEQSRESHGSHALLAVGYSDQSYSFIVRNSWGKYWGDNGYCYIPYDYMTDPNLCFDMWTVRQLASDDFGQDHWDNYDSVDYHYEEQDPDGNEEPNRGIEHFDNENDVFNDMANFAGKVIGSFISLAL
ncbi:unnamed protein product [Adineta steineri]|uniref:Peptidase C1A papain C-terminal domain-containing protein n=1 Tax=Adineta steineri TaxID=433720 RepID=A0A818S7C5_9BILA|nr:unnamed protein product [Adineta steineri]CAF0908693.1 unnamed protein product [Adineta steineri]CAF3661984.1 unnamed protein product [Adineta steineri]CAF3778096.1 unnamed protein product [Adineta steineri]